MAINKIERQNVSEAAMKEIQRLIIGGEWKQGSKLPSENELAKMMGVSRVTIRSALQKLSSVGLIESRQGEGTFVSTLDGGHYVNMLIPLTMLEEENQKSVMEFRRIIETEQAALAAKRATEEDIRKLTENYEQMMQLDCSSQEFCDMDIEFHLLIAEASKNPLLIKTTNILQGIVTENIIYYTRQTNQNLAGPYHKEIMDAIAAHDPNAARNAMKRHLDRAMSVVEEIKLKR
jgi:GntR family transcriptional repressor for pyruvate dehydrogenase complex